MLRRSHTAVIEKNETRDADFATEPYECGWASEASWFVRVLEGEAEQFALRALVQVSPDGLHWCDKGGEKLEMTRPGLAHLAVRDFGGWLRLRVELSGRKPKVKLLVYLALKE